jgi:hypothetical protein
MIEDEPFECATEMEPTRVELKGPNVVSTFDIPPRADAVRTQQAAIRKHLEGRRPRSDSPDGP